MIPQLVERSWSADAFCSFSLKWRIDPTLAWQLQQLAQLLPFTIKIISGWRSAAEQQQLEREGRPTAAFHLSTHTSCPWATGADLQLSVQVTDAVKRQLGEACKAVGLRWGGGSPLENGIPTDWNHVDLGPRSG